MSFTASLDDIILENESGLLAKHNTWERVLLGEVGKVLNGFAFPSGLFSNDSGFPLLRIRDILSDTTETRYKGEYDPQYVIRAGDLLVGMDGDFNSAIWKGSDALLNQRVCKISVNPEFYDLKFLSFVLPAYLNAINRETSSITVKHLSSQTVSEIPLPLPALNEQSRIANELDALMSDLDAAVAALRRVQANLKRYRASVLKAACEGRLVPTEAELARKEGRTYETGEQLLSRILKERRAKWEADQLSKMLAAGKPPKNDDWKKKYKEPDPPDTSKLPKLPLGWYWTNIDTIAETVGGITKGQKRRETDTLRSVPYLRVANVQRGYLNLAEIKEIEATEEEIQELTLKQNDVLFNEGGDRDKLGRGWIWEGQLAECIHQNHVYRARLLNDDVSAKFVSYFANSEGQRYFLDEGKQTTNLASINLTKLRAFPLPLPPASEQARIITEIQRQLDYCDTVLVLSNTALRRAERLRQSILKRAFEGKLVSQDPNDEPASVLLERIRAELAANKETKMKEARHTKVLVTHG